MTVSPSPLRGRLLRGRGSPKRRIPCSEAVDQTLQGMSKKFPGPPGGHSEFSFDHLARSNRPPEAAEHAFVVDDFRLKSKSCVTRLHRGEI